MDTVTGGVKEGVPPELRVWEGLTDAVTVHDPVADRDAVAVIDEVTV